MWKNNELHLLNKRIILSDSYAMELHCFHYCRRIIGLSQQDRGLKTEVIGQPTTID